MNKQAAINKCGEQMWSDILSGEALLNPSLLTRFILLTFAVSYHISHPTQMHILNHCFCRI